MFAVVRAGLFAALAVLAFIVTSSAADKAFQRDELADAAIRLESEIKRDAGRVEKPAATLRRDADAAFQRNDYRSGLQLLGQAVAAAPDDSATWLRLARAILQIGAANEREKALLLERASTAAYIAYQRTTSRTEEAESLVILGRTFGDRKLWRPTLDSLRLSLELREAADVRAQYERLRDEHGFRLLDYSVDTEASSPRACFQFSEDLPGKRVDFSPFVAVGGIDRPAISVDQKQLCVEGLKHGDRYTVTLRAGLPSVVKETLAKSADFTIYVRDRKPFARFTGKNYVLPRSGQRGIPVVSVNTDSVAVQVYRISDRNLTDTVIGSNFQRNLEPYEIEHLATDRAAAVWKGELTVEKLLNTDVVTAFPIDQTLGDLAPGVYVMTAAPKDAPSNDYEAVATQWFIVSDLGLTAYSANDGIHVFVHLLSTADPKGLVDVRLVSRSNEVLATRRTDGAGYALFEPGLTRGEGGLEPAILIATDQRNDYAFLSLKSPPFDLSDRGVTGRVTPAGLDALVYTERGVYRSGETVHVTALLRDGRGTAALGVPLTLVIERPDGVEYRRVAVPDQGVGGHSLSVPITSAAASGTWRVRAFTDPKRPPVGESTFMVEDYVPDRLEFDLTSKTNNISTLAPAEVSVSGRYLYGAPAGALDLEGELIVSAAKERSGFPGYVFGAADENVNATRKPLEDLPQTGADGKASFKVALDKPPETTRPLQAQVVIRMAEAGGRAVERKLDLPVVPPGPRIGVKPLFSGRSLGDGEQARFDVIVAAPDGTALARSGLRYELLQVDTRYQWYKQDGVWQFEPVKSTKRVADGTFNIAADKPAQLSLPVSIGRYRLEVSGNDTSEPTTSITFDAGWYAEASADTPDLLEIALDKAEYQAGDTMTVAVTARTAGRLTLNVIGDRLTTTIGRDVKPGVNKLTLGVGRDWGSGAYVLATLRRPLDAKEQRMPGRAIGVQWFSIDRKAHTLALNMQLPATLRPQTKLRIPVKIEGLESGAEARVVVAAVDVGILNLTNYKPPSPDDYYLGQRRIAADLRDLYGQLIDGMQGARGQVRTGGDAGGGELQGSPPAQAPLAFYSGIVTVKPDGSAEVEFDVPAFAGTVRVMAVAWSKDRVGHATGDVIVRDPVVLTASLPRFLLTGDRSMMRLDLDNAEGVAGDYSLAVRTEGSTVTGGGVTQTLKLQAKQRDFVAVPLAGTKPGDTALNVRISGPGGFLVERTYPLTTYPATQTLTRRTVRALAKGESLTLSSDLFADFVPGTGGLALSVGLSTAFDAATSLTALERYPFGCSEQLVSRAIALLYVKDLASAGNLPADLTADTVIRDAIERLLARQGSNGSFGLWSAGGEDIWLDAYVTDFFTRARERGFAVPDPVFKLAVERLRNFVGYAPELQKDGGRNLAYALYVLARNGAAPVGDLRYLADTKLDSLATPIAKAQIAAALGMLGDKSRAERVYAAAIDSAPEQPRLEIGRLDYGSALRDAAALVTLASEGGAQAQTISKAVLRAETARGLSRSLSTQENAWLVLAARAIAKAGSTVSLDVAGESRQGPLFRNLRAGDLEKGPLKVTNTGEGTVQTVVSVSGAPVIPEPATDSGFKIERIYNTPEGEPVNPSQVKQNQRFVVVLRITEPQPQFARVVVADYLPAGFEIDNPHLVSSGETTALDWIANAAEPAHAEFRDNRFTAAFDRKSGDPAVFSVAYVVRAVTPGKYTLPQAYVEDMYRPDRFGRTGTGTVEISGK